MGVETQGKGRQSLTHSLLCSNHPITEIWQNVHLWRESLIIKFENVSNIWINIGYISECTLSAMSHGQVTLLCASYRLQLTITTSL